MKKFEYCNYLGCDWIYCGKEERGIRLKSMSKHLSDVVVDYGREKMINTGLYVSGSFRKR